MRRSVALTAIATIGLTGSVFASQIAPENVTFVDDIEVPISLTGQAGDAAKGREWYAGRKLGNCLACHATTDLNELPFHGEVGPAMDGVADRYEEAQLRAILVNSKKVFGDQTIMPGFYVVNPGARTAGDFQGQTIMSAQQIEDVIAYLKTLTE
ncbi:MAG: sulfur oxidation c-type cytochrome SoxX [Ahrensia sp.]|nr:sulfur oxidation c-type cytochrome SoxX [Ahrensia sp.]